MTDWDTYAICACGFAKRAPFGDPFHIHLTVCPRCGEHKKGFKLVVMRWNHSKVKLWNPFTWFSGYWEVKHDGEK